MLRTIIVVAVIVRVRSVELSCLNWLYSAYFELTLAPYNLSYILRLFELNSSNQRASLAPYAQRALYEACAAVDR